MAVVAIVVMVLLGNATQLLGAVTMDEVTLTSQTVVVVMCVAVVIVSLWVETGGRDSGRMGSTKRIKCNKCLPSCYHNIYLYLLLVFLNKKHFFNVLVNNCAIPSYVNK